jgi:hypothetical protein
MAAHAVSINMQDLTPPHPPDPTKDLVAGYPALAGHIGLFPQYGIFRRFGAVNARNLLYLQAEIIYLEKELVHVEAIDKKSTEDGRSNFCATWLALSDHKASPNDEMKRQWGLIMKLRDRLKTYSKH